MKSKILYSIVTFALVVSACNKNLKESKIEDESEFHAIRQKDLGDEYTVFSDGIVAVIIDGRQEYVTQFKLIDDHGNTEYAFCANMEAPCNEGARYKCVDAGDYFKNGAETKIMAALTYIMNEYRWMETANPNGYRQIMQCVIWMIIHGYEVTSVNNTEVEIIMDVINHIYDNIDEMTSHYNTGVTMQGVDASSRDGLFVNYGPYKVSENALLADVDFILTFDREFGPYVKFVNDLGMEITQVKPEEPFYVRVSDNIFGDVDFTATASVSKELWYVNDFRFYIDVREGDYQQLFQPVMNPEAWIYFYSCDGKISIIPTEVEGEDDDVSEKITLTELNWNNGNGNGNGGGINRFTVNGITLKNNKNYVTPVSFDFLATKVPGKNDETAIYTVLDRSVTEQNGDYGKVYDIKVAFYNDGVWKAYGGTITVDNQGGNNTNQKVELEKIF